MWFASRLETRAAGSRAVPLRAQGGWLLVLGAGAACSAPPGSGRELGSDLGTFHVAASATENSCGKGSLGSTERFEFDVELARADSQLFWDGRVGGRVGSALDFEVRALISVPLRAAAALDPGCTVNRSDRIQGVLGATTSGDVTDFEAELRYDFAADPAHACNVDDLLAAGLTQLPCGMQYALSAERSRSPEAPVPPSPGKSDLPANR
jgi:hypothetical protein